jgi:polar amino acid transport system permease protein
MSNYRLDWHFVGQSLPFLLGGIGTTVYVSGAAALLTIPISLLAAAGRQSRFGPLRGLVKLYIDAFRSTPFLVQLVWFFFGLPILIDYRLSPVQAAVIALALYIGSYEAEVVRSGILSLEGGQQEAAFALGMTRWQAYRRIILPQAMVRMIPPSLNTLIILIKESAVVSAVSVTDLMWRATAVATRSYRPIEPLTFAALAYMAVILPLTLVARRFYNWQRMSFE